MQYSVFERIISDNPSGGNSQFFNGNGIRDWNKEVSESNNQNSSEITKITQSNNQKNSKTKYEIFHTVDNIQ